MIYTTILICLKTTWPIPQINFQAMQELLERKIQNRMDCPTFLPAVPYIFYFLLSLSSFREGSSCHSCRQMKELQNKQHPIYMGISIINDDGTNLYN